MQKKLAALTIALGALTACQSSNITAPNNTQPGSTSPSTSPSPSSAAPTNNTPSQPSTTSGVQLFINNELKPVEYVRVTRDYPQELTLTFGKLESFTSNVVFKSTSEIKPGFKVSDFNTMSASYQDDKLDGGTPLTAENVRFESTTFEHFKGEITAKLQTSPPADFRLVFDVAIP